MAGIYTAIHVEVQGATVAHHCDHDDGTASWRIAFPEHVDGNAYLCGTVGALEKFGEAILKAASARRPVELEPVKEGE